MKTSLIETTATYRDVFFFEIIIFNFNFRCLLDHDFPTAIAVPNSVWDEQSCHPIYTYREMNQDMYKPSLNISTTNREGFEFMT